MRPEDYQHISRDRIVSIRKFFSLEEPALADKLSEIKEKPAHDDEDDESRYKSIKSQPLHMFA